MPYLISLLIINLIFLFKIEISQVITEVSEDPTDFIYSFNLKKKGANPSAKEAPVQAQGKAQSHMYAVLPPKERPFSGFEPWTPGVNTNVSEILLISK